MREKLTDEQVSDALRDVAENDGHMYAPVSDAEIVARWQALKDAGYVRARGHRHRLTEAGRAALNEARDADQESRNDR